MADLPTHEEIAKLPRWAIVAFAARCARLVEPAFLKSKLDQRHKDAVSLAIKVAESYASRADATSSHDATSSADAAYAAYAASADADAYAYAYAYAAKAAYYAAAAAAAAKAAYYAADDDDAAAAAAKAAYYAAEAVPNLGSQISRDFASLLERASKGGWTDETPVPQSVFGPLPNLIDEEREPALDKVASAFSATQGLAFDLWIDPGGASTDDIVDLYAALSDLNRAHGGNGLAFDSGRNRAYILKET